MYHLFNNMMLWKIGHALSPKVFMYSLSDILANCFTFFVYSFTIRSPWFWPPQLHLHLFFFAFDLPQAVVCVNLIPLSARISIPSLMPVELRLFDGPLMYNCHVVKFSYYGYTLISLSSYCLLTRLIFSKHKPPLYW